MARRELRRQSRRSRAQTGGRVAGLVAVLLVGASATAAGVSADPAKTPKAFGASETRDLGALDLAVARQSVTPRPVEGFLLTQAAAEQEQRAVEKWVFTARVNEAKAQAQAAVAQGVAQASVARDAAKAAAVRAAAPAPAPAPVPAQHTGVNWDGIARCETGGNWSMQGSRFSGGLGFANSTWSSFGGGQFAGNAGQASREQQIVVAERVYARYGLSGWGCRRFG
ncbi:MAG TPA: transglycosylase family protein [Acidimicrobiia bacterium]